MSTHDERRRDLRAEMERRRDRVLVSSAPAWRTRRRRRALAVATVVVVLADLIAAHLNSTSWWSLVGILVALLALVLLRVLTRGVAESTDSTLDERDRALRDKVVRWTFFVAPTALIGVGIYARMTGDLPDLAERVTNLAFIAAWASVGTPTLLLAWILSDDDPEDLV